MQFPDTQNIKSVVAFYARISNWKSFADTIMTNDVPPDNDVQMKRNPSTLNMQDPDVFQCMSRYVEKMTAIMKSFGGEILWMRGQHLMAAFSCSEEKRLEKVLRRAIECGMDVLKNLHNTPICEDGFKFQLQLMISGITEKKKIQKFFVGQLLANKKKPKFWEALILRMEAFPI